MTNFYRFLAVVLLFPSIASAQCDGIRFHDYLFPGNPIVTSNITYGSNLRFNGASETLAMDVYQPAGDTASVRPLVIVAHGGSFIGGSKTGADVVPLCRDLAKLGYVSASIQYRIGIRNFPIPGPNNADATEAVIRAVQDARAAIRFFRKNVTESGNTYRIDTTKIYMAGVSAGGFIALHVAYLDQPSEMPSWVDLTQPGLGGGLEGLSGNPGYSSKVKGIINIAGAIGDTAWIQPGDIPVLSTHGTADGTVPFGTDVITLAGLFPIMTVHGSNSVHIRANNVGLTNCFEIHEGAGHVPHVSNATYYDTTIVLARNFLEYMVCGVPLNCDYTATPEVVSVTNLKKAKAGFSVSPNPAHQQFIVESQLIKAQTTLTISNLLGQQVHEQIIRDNRTLIDATALPRGVYIVNLRNSDESSSLRLVLD